MNRHDFEFEEFIVPVAVGLTFHGFDFVVGAFQRAVTEPRGPVQQAFKAWRPADA